MSSYQPLFELSPDTTPYRLVTKDFVRMVDTDQGALLVVEREGLVRLAREALRDVNFYFRPGHLAKLAAILEDPEASDNDRFVALTELRNAVVAAQGQLPSCQDTGTATVIAKKGQSVWTGFDDEAAIAEGIAATYAEENLRYSQMAPLTMFEEKNTGT